MHANDIRTDINSALCDYNARVELNNRLLTIEDTCPRQQALSHAIDSQILKTICEESHNIYTQAHLNLTTASGAGSWLNSIPSKALGTHIDPSLYRTTILRWLSIGLVITASHVLVVGIALSATTSSGMRCFMSASAQVLTRNWSDLASSNRGL